MNIMKTQIAPNSGGNLAPFVKGDRSDDFEILVALKAAFLVEMIVD
jgi:hypothetical protein